MLWSGFGLHGLHPLGPRCGAFSAPLPPHGGHTPFLCNWSWAVCGPPALPRGGGLLLGIHGDPVPPRVLLLPRRVCASVPPPWAEAAAVCKPVTLSGASCLSPAGPHPPKECFYTLVLPSHSLQHQAVGFPDKAGEITGCYLWRRACEHKRPLSLRLPALPDSHVSPLVVFITLEHVSSSLFICWLLLCVCVCVCVCSLPRMK